VPRRYSLVRDGVLVRRDGMLVVRAMLAALAVWCEGQVEDESCTVQQPLLTA
jgi:hypothetical protein